MFYFGISLIISLLWFILDIFDVMKQDETTEILWVKKEDIILHHKTKNMKMKKMIFGLVLLLSASCPMNVSAQGFIENVNLACFNKDINNTIVR